MELINHIKDQAKKILTEFKCLAPMIFFLREEKIIKMSPLSAVLSGMPKLMEEVGNTERYTDTGMIAIGVMSRILKADSVIFVHDGAMKYVDNAHKIDITETPLSYPKSMRRECIMIVHLIFGTDKGSITVVPYSGGDGEPVTFTDDEFTEKSDKMESRMTDTIMFGYEKFKEYEGK